MAASTDKMFGGGRMPDLGSEELQTQAQHIWSMLDDMAASDPAAYRKFIDKQLKEGKEVMSPPKPYMCVQTSMHNPKRLLYINVCSLQRLPEPKSDEDPIPVIGGQLYCVHEESEKYHVVGVVFNPKVLEEFGWDAKQQEERHALINLAIDYLQDQHNVTISRRFKLLPKETPLKGPVEKLTNSFKPKSSKEDEKFEQELDELEKTFGPMPAGAKNTILSQLNKISLESSDPMKSTVSSSQPDLLLEPEKQNQPIKRGLIEEIGVETIDGIQCPEYVLKTEKSQLEMVIKLTGVSTVRDCELDISEDDISLSVPDKYKLFVKLPRTICDEDAKARFNKKLERLTITMPTR